MNVIETIEQLCKKEKSAERDAAIAEQLAKLPEGDGPLVKVHSREPGKGLGTGDLEHNRLCELLAQHPWQESGIFTHAIRLVTMQAPANTILRLLDNLACFRLQVNEYVAAIDGPFDLASLVLGGTFASDDHEALLDALRRKPLDKKEVNDFTRRMIARQGAELYVRWFAWCAAVAPARSLGVWIRSLPREFRRHAYATISYA